MPPCIDRGQGGGAGHRAGFAVHTFQIVIQDQIFGALVQAPGVLGDEFAGLEHPDLSGAEADLESASDEPGGVRWGV